MQHRLLISNGLDYEHLDILIIVIGQYYSITSTAMIFLNYKSDYDTKLRNKSILAC